jgi:hypothetical protein
MPVMADERKDDLTAQIMAEIIRAIVRLGGDPKLLPESPSQVQLLDLLRQSGADRYLIGTVASWNDTIEDTEVLDDLRRLNEGKPYFDQILASRKDE